MIGVFFINYRKKLAFLKGLAFFFAMVVVFIAFEQSSSAHYHIQEDESDFFPKKALIKELPFLKEYFSESYILGDIPKSYKGSLLSTTEVQQSYPEGMIPFITGLIVVYLPEIENAGELAKEIVRIGNEEQLDPLYIAAIISVESRFSVKAKSKVGAMGLMQLMPETAQEIISKKKIRASKATLTDPKTNILLGVHYIKQLEKKYRSNRARALAAYNWGLGKVDRSIKEGTEIPESVKRYASTIVTRTTRWNKHFKEANEREKLLLAGK